MADARHGEEMAPTADDPDDYDLRHFGELLFVGYGLPNCDVGTNDEEYWCITGVGPRVWMEGARSHKKIAISYKVVGVQNEGQDVPGMLIETTNESTVADAWAAWVADIPELEDSEDE